MLQHRVKRGGWEWYIQQHQKLTTTPLFPKNKSTLLHHQSSPPLRPPSVGAEFIQVYPQGGLGTPCNLPLKPRPRKHILFTSPKEVPGSWADRPAGVQEEWEEGGMLIVALRGCVCSRPGPLQLKVYTHTCFILVVSIYNCPSPLLQWTPQLS